MSSLLKIRPIGRLYLLICLSSLLVACQTGTNVASSPAASAAFTPVPTTIASPPPATDTAQSPLAVAATQTITSTASSELGEPSEEPSTVTSQPDELATIELLNSIALPARDQVELAYAYGRTQTKQREVRTTPLDVKVGDKQSFNATDVGAASDDPNRNFVINATLALILDHVLIYVEDGVEVDMEALEQSSREFNDKIYPRTRELFGSEWTPGIDGDPRLTILNARIPSAGGYFSSADEVPRSVNKYSNEREMFYINIDSYIPGTPEYASTLAHEFQHMIQWNEAERTPTWSNEGLSQLAQELNGFEEDASGSTVAYLADPDIQLTTWGATPADSAAHYGGSYLFMSYFYEQYGKDLDLRRLIREAAGENLEVFATIAQQQNKAIQDFGDLFADWAIANVLNNRRVGQGRYAYNYLTETIEPQAAQREIEDTVAQFGVDYWQIPVGAKERVLRFDGSDTIQVVTAQPQGRAMWWSNRGDDMHSTLTRTVDLRNVASATLQFRLWHQIEDGWDYGFVSVSTDGGQRFTTLPGRHTTSDDPQNQNFGHGYTGTSGAPTTVSPDQNDIQPSWIEEQIDLTPYVGKQILLRFSLVNDQGFNLPGIALDSIAIPEINFRDDAENEGAEWQANGFVRTDNQLDQQWEVRIVRIKGQTVAVEPLALDQQEQGEVRLAPNERGIVVIAPTTPHTTERASYQLSLGQR